MELIGAAPPGERLPPGLCPAFTAYRIGPDSTLLRAVPPPPNEGYLVLTDCAAPPLPDPSALAGALLSECRRQGYRGILLDFALSRRRDLAELVSVLDAASRRPSLTVPEVYGDAAPHARVLVGTAVSGGSLSHRLREAAARWGGPERLILDAERVQTDFSLPSPSGEGRRLSSRELAGLRQSLCPATFFSPALCARYFSYFRDGQGHFVLFDDADTLRRKLRLGAEFGILAAVLLWPEVREIWGALRGGW